MSCCCDDQNFDPPAPPTDVGGVLYWGNSNVGAAADTRFLMPGRDGGLAPIVSVGRFVMPRAATLRNLFVRHNSAGGNGAAVTYTLMVNGVATALTVALATGAVGQASNVATSIAVVQGDFVAIQASKAAAIGGGIVDVMASMEVA